MIIGGNKGPVIENMKAAATAGDFNRKVELGDPVLSKEESERLVNEFIEKSKTVGYHMANVAARAVADTVTKMLNKNTKILGLENLKGIDGSAIVTSNHFNPLDNTVVRYAMNKAGYDRLFMVSQDSNLAMPSWIGFLMNHEDIIPISKDKKYLTTEFEELIKKNLKRKRVILIYPEEEMWFNYRKPRPPKRGAYLYAAKNHVPVISCFVEIHDLEKMDNDEFHQVEYTMHILKPIYPDPAKTERENSIEMMHKDYAQKVEAYERAYGKKLTYDFESDDIAGWAGEL